MRFGRGTPNQIVWSPDGKTLAVSESTGVWLYEVAKLQAPPRLGYDQAAYGLAFEPTGILVFTDGNSLRLLDIAHNGQQTVLSDTGDGTALAISQNGSKLVWGQVNGTVQVWDLVTNKLSSTLSIFPGAIAATALSSDGRFVAGSSTKGIDRNTVKLWDTADGKVYSLPADPNGTTALVFSPNKYLLAASGPSGLRLWNYASQRLVAQIKNPVTDYQLAFSPDGQFLADVGMTIRIVPTTNPTLQRILSTNDFTQTATFSPDSKRLASISNSGTLRIWNIADGQQEAIVADENHTSSNLTFSPDSRLLATGTADGTIWLRNARTGQSVKELPGKGAPIQRVVFSPDGKFFAAVGYSGAIMLWDTDSWTITARLSAVNPNSISFSPDGKWMAVGDDDGVQVWTVADGTLLRSLDNQSGSDGEVTFSPDGRFLIDVGSDNLLKIRYFLNGKVYTTWHDFNVRDLALNPENSNLAIVDDLNGTGVVRLLDSTAHKVLFTLVTRNSATRTAFSPDGNLLVIGEEDGTLEVVNVNNGQFVATLESHSSPITSIGFSKDGTRIGATYRDGTTAVWGS